MTYDAIIIGAGPAGAHLGYLLASGGMTVAIVDRAVFPRDKLCGGLLTQKALILLSAAYPNKKFGGFDIKQAHIFYKGSPITSIHLLSTVNTIRRYQFDATLVNAAAVQGADTYWGDPVTNIDFIKQEVYLKSGRSLRYAHLIGADGALSKVRHLAGLPTGRLGFCMEAYLPWNQVKDKSHLCAGGIELSYGSYATGYGWVFPNRKSVVVGVGDLASTMSIKEIVQSFPKFINRITKSDGIKFRGAYIPSGSSVVLGNPDFKNLYLIGDAAGLIDPFTGEGIYYALLSAEKAATVLLARSPDFTAYYQHMYETIEQIRAGVQVRDEIYKPTILRSVIGVIQDISQYGDTLIDETIIRYSKPYTEAYEEFREYMR